MDEGGEGGGKQRRRENYRSFPSLPPPPTLRRTTASGIKSTTKRHFVNNIFQQVKGMKKRYSGLREGGRKKNFLQTKKLLDYEFIYRITQTDAIERIYCFSIPPRTFSFAP